MRTPLESIRESASISNRFLMWVHIIVVLPQDFPQVRIIAHDILAHALAQHAQRQPDPLFYYQADHSAHPPPVPALGKDVAP